jgi:hypothetical protein
MYKYCTPLYNINDFIVIIFIFYIIAFIRNYCHRLKYFIGCYCLPEPSLKYGPVHGVRLCESPSIVFFSWTRMNKKTLRRRRATNIVITDCTAVLDPGLTTVAPLTNPFRLQRVHNRTCGGFENRRTDGSIFIGAGTFPRPKVRWIRFARRRFERCVYVSVLPPRLRPTSSFRTRRKTTKLSSMREAGQ